MKYQVIVGNIGMVHDGNNKAVAMKVYKEYVDLSEKEVGSAAGEDVCLHTKDGTIEQHFGFFSKEGLR